MTSITIIPTSQVQSLDSTNEKESKLSANDISILPPRSDTEDDDGILPTTMIKLDESGLHQVFLSSEHILLHMDDPTVVESKCQELWELGQQLKHSPMNSSNLYSKVIQWIIYHCRGSIAYHKKDWDRAILACQTCLAIDLPTHTLKSSESLILQKVALMLSHTYSILEKSLAQRQQYRPPSSITSDSSSSTASTMMVCSFCAVEKRTMPVCAQCKLQRYCGIKCLKLDKENHSSRCLRH